MTHNLSLALLAAWASLSAADAPAEPLGPAVQPKFTCTPAKPQDEYAFSTGADGVVLRLTSASGIGSARVNLTEGDVPRRLTLRFPKMRCLEEFTVGDGKIALRGVMGCDDAFDKDGKRVADPKDAVYFLKARRNREQDYIEVETSLPLGDPGAKRWEMSWKDAFRR